jgi:molybdenum cofactor biosynthesis protein B
MIMGNNEHGNHSAVSLAIGVITLSSTRTPADDASGKWIIDTARQEGHQVVFYQVILDDADTIRQSVLNVIRESGPNLLLLTGGTGITSGDVTIEAVRPLFQKELTAFGPLFAQLSFEEIGAAAVLSRAAAGIIGKTAVFCMPGSLKACRLACSRLIFPHAGHLVRHMTA